MGIHMKPADTDAIARFIQRGGQIRKVAATIPATEQDVLAYLAGRGLTVKYFPGESKPYACNCRRYSLDGLLRLANTHRSEKQLPPLMLGRHISVASRTQGEQLDDPG